MDLPKRIDLSKHDIDALFSRIENNQLEDADRALVKQVIEFSCWLQQGLENADVNLATLRKLFGLLAQKKSL
jgi:hypothetical protein